MHFFAKIQTLAIIQTQKHRQKNKKNTYFDIHQVHSLHTYQKTSAKISILYINITKLATINKNSIPSLSTSRNKYIYELKTK